MQTLTSKKINAAIWILLAASGAIVSGQVGIVPTSTPQLKAVQDPRFKPGQIWSYRTRQGEEASTLTILRTESTPKLGTIIHIRVDKIRLANCRGGPEPDNIAHMPFARRAIERSVVKLLQEHASIPEHEGYNDWRQAFENGKAGVYTITVSEAVGADQASFSNGLGCPR